MGGENRAAPDVGRLSPPLCWRWSYVCPDVCADVCADMCADIFVVTFILTFVLTLALTFVLTLVLTICRGICPHLSILTFVLACVQLSHFAAVVRPFVRPLRSLWVS